MFFAHRVFLLASAFVLISTQLGMAQTSPSGGIPIGGKCTSDNTVVAHVVALEQIYVYNRFGAFNPGGMLYALRRDVVVGDDDEVEGFEPGAAIPLAPDTVADAALAGNVRLRPDKRPRPIVLRVNEGDCLRIVFTNLLSPDRDSEEHFVDPETGELISVDSDEPATRAASIHVNGLELSGSVGSDGSNVGYNESSLADPGQTQTYTLIGRREGGYLLYSLGAPAGGEGDGGQLGLGLFGSVNVEPPGSTWYRSQVTGPELDQTLDLASDKSGSEPGHSASGTPIIDYAATTDGTPILNMTRTLPRGSDAKAEIVHSDLNAIIDVTPANEPCDVVTGPGSSCGEPFREFTVIFHDEITAFQAFAELDNEDNPISALKDGMGINYGAAGLGAMVLSNRNGTGPAKDCVECKLEEFFLTSWAMGDPALVIERDASNNPVRALYPDDPSNVHHSYLGDPVRFRNLHAGPKETHVFHLHAHQWTQDWHDPDSVYLDSQTIAPGASFTYEVHYGGSGNRSLTPGDSIFHCHLYPHFAQGMWELWRTHDVFEAGTPDRWLPDHEISGGTPNPAVVPLPRAALPPMPDESFRGYPFYIAGVPGHRPPQAPLDIAPDVYDGDPDETLLRHVVLGGTRGTGAELFGTDENGDPTDLEKKYFDATIAEDDPAGQSNRIAARVRSQNGDTALFGLAAKLTEAWIDRLPLDGTPSEQAAMAFHAGLAPGAVTVERSKYGLPEKAYPSCTSDGTCNSNATPVLFRVNGYLPKPGAPYADPCAKRFYLGKTTDDPDDPSLWFDLPEERRYRAAYIQFDMPVNKHGWHDPQARIIALERDAPAILSHDRAPEPFFFRANSGECVVFEATNLIPSNLNLDDFQVFTPTDTIGQHIHLVKFDVTSSDGSGNGWNYEDGTFSPDEIRERIIANNAFKGYAELRPLTHRLFLPDGPFDGTALADRGICPETLPADPVQAEIALEDHPWCGAQTTIQRWWADPLLNQIGEDRTIRTVFTHDHFGPSSHQQHGFYAALVIEPNGSSWKSLAGRMFGGQDVAGEQVVLRDDGGPTSYAANIEVPATDTSPEKSMREYNLAVADFALLYTAPPANRPISPPGQLDHDLPEMFFGFAYPRPEGISVSDPGGQVLNYRNEPIPARVGTENSNGRWSLKTYDAGDVAACRAGLEARRAVATPIGAGPLSMYSDCRNSGLDPTVEAQCVERVVKALCDPSDMANVFSTLTHAGQDESIRAAIAADGLAYDTRRIFLDNYARKDCADTDDLNCNEPAGIRQDGDPATPILSVREGDDLLVRLVQGAQEENHIFFMNGAKWLAEPGSVNSGYRAAQHIGISEHFEFNIAQENPSPQLTVDQLYGTTASDNLWDGQWGLVRTLGAAVPADDLSPLPTNGAPDELVRPAPTVCQPGMPLRHFDVTAKRLRDLSAKALRYHRDRDLSDPNARIYIASGEWTFDENGAREDVVLPEQSDLEKMESGTKAPEPLILRARAGECIEVTLTNAIGTEAEPVDHEDGAAKFWSWNMMPPIANGLNFNQVRMSNTVGLHAQLLAANTLSGDGSFAGLNRSSLAYPCDDNSDAICDPTVTYSWLAGDWTKKPQDNSATLTPMEFGAVGLQDFADVIKGGSHGLIGALVVEPRNATWTTDCDRLREDPAYDREAGAQCLNAAATVCLSGGADCGPNDERFREFVVLYQNDASLRYKGEALANLRNGDDAEDSGQKAFNYRFEPFWTRLDANPAADPESMMEYDFSNVLSSKEGEGDPSTPLFTTEAGMPLRIRVLQPSGHPRNGAFTLSGHSWTVAPWADQSRVQTASPGRQNVTGVVNAIGPGRHENILIESAGGPEALTGDFLFHTPVGFAFGGGQWGIMRVYDPAECGEDGLVTDPNTGRHQVCR